VTALQTEIEARLAGVEPEVEVLLAEASGPRLRLFIDHPGGVTLELCERVSGHLNDYRERYSLEVSSPGQDRPLTRPQHYSRFLGHRA
jgi:ribosome maturation factor RimP